MEAFDDEYPVAGIQNDRKTHNAGYSLPRSFLTRTARGIKKAGL